MTLILTVLLILLFGVAGYFVFQLFINQRQITALENELTDAKTKSDEDTKKFQSCIDSVKSKHEEERKKVVQYIAVLKAEIQALSKWKDVADADKKAQELIQEAQTVLNKANIDAQQLLTDAKQQADAILGTATTEANTLTAESKQKVKATQDEVRAILDAATIQAKQVLEVAEAKAKEIAGGAYEILKNSALYERTAKAMKNIINGYGNEYIVPVHSLLDELAEEFGFTQAGQELKAARERTKMMIKNGTAATCDYVEASRRETAINFVIDAFNGKVDSILSRVRHDNPGVLKQEIQDAFSIVNYNGKAFRDARITEEYLNSRLNELRWSAVAQELKLQEREEQRRIKEQIREEEKARKEYERAIREAAKEEDLLKKAIEKAQQQIEKVSAEQKFKYEQQLLELGQKLKEAEERNQRALSMAQQTRRGHVYIISNIGSFGENVYKIGLTRRLEPLDRIRELGDSSVPFEFDVHALLFSEDAPALESKLHKHFVFMQMNKVNHRKEFFKVDLKHIREEIEKLQISAKWTMTAEAKDYRETLAIERAISEKPELREAWVSRQLELESIVSEEIEEDSPDIAA
jgi:hypothetical protein